MVTAAAFAAALGSSKLFGLALIAFPFLELKDEADDEDVEEDDDNEEDADGAWPFLFLFDEVFGDEDGDIELDNEDGDDELDSELFNGPPASCGTPKSELFKPDENGDNIELFNEKLIEFV